MLTKAEILEKYGPSNNGDVEDMESYDPESWKENDM